MGRGRTRNRVDNLVEPQRAVGWTAQLPPGLDPTQDTILIRRLSPTTGAASEQWQGSWSGPQAPGPVETCRNRSLDVVIAWARSTGVAQILIEDVTTGVLRRLE